MSRLQKNHVYKRAEKNLKVCLHCGYHHTMTAFERVESLLDDGIIEYMKIRFLKIH